LATLLLENFPRDTLIVVRVPTIQADGSRDYSSEQIKNVKVIENLPVTINTYDGFRLVFTYSTADGLAHKTLYYGFVIGDMF